MYNDYKLVSDREAVAMRQKFDESKQAKISDLRDIYDSMLLQRDRIKGLNDTSYDGILSTYDRHLQTLQRIIDRESGSIVLASATEPYGKIPSANEISRHENILDSTDTPDTSFGKVPNSADTTLNSTEPPIVRNQKRNSPMQSHAILTANRQSALKIPYKGLLELLAEKTSNKSVACKDKTILNGQIDILRLILLLIALRPNYACVPRLCTIANEQFGVLLQLI